MKIREITSSELIFGGFLLSGTTVAEALARECWPCRQAMAGVARRGDIAREGPILLLDHFT